MVTGATIATFAAALVVAASLMDPLIPPSIMFIIYAVQMNVSIADLFIAGADNYADDHVTLFDDVIQRLAATIEKIANDYAGKVKVGKIDTDAIRDVAMRYEFSAIPTVPTLWPRTCAPRRSGGRATKTRPLGETTKW